MMKIFAICKIQHLYDACGTTKSGWSTKPKVISSSFIVIMMVMVVLFDLCQPWEEGQTSREGGRLKDDPRTLSNRIAWHRLSLLQLNDMPVW
jgi:hypothetical protein